MIRISVQTQLSDIFSQDGEFARRLGQIIWASHLVLEREYKVEVPVNKSFLRKSVKSTKLSNLSYETGANIAYAEFVAMGTGIFKGGADAGYTTGRVRHARYSQDDILLFKVLAKRHKLKGVRPNKFHERAEKRALTPIMQFLARELANIEQ